MRMLRSALLVAGLACMATPVSAAPITIDFEALTEFTDVGALLAGATFTNATVLTAGTSLNDFDFPPQSGTNVVFDTAETMRIDFDTAVSSVSAYITYVAAVTFSAYDSSDNLITSVLSSFPANFVTSGVGAPNELIQLGSTSAISYVTLSASAFGGSFTLDDLTFDTIEGGGGDPNPPIPEPATVTLVLLGAAVAAGRQKLRARRQARA
jgi:hypothetical protein